jgi:hypothetical protein
MKKWMFMVTLAAAGTGGLSTLYAEPTTGAGAPRAVPDTAAMRLSRLTMSRDVYDDMMQKLVHVVSIAAEGNGLLRPRDAKQLEPLMVEALPYEELLQLTAEVYAAHFSGKEMDDVLAFYKTPTGMKFAKEQLGMGKEVTMKTVPIMEQRMPALLKKHGLATDAESKDHSKADTIRTSAETASARARLDKLRADQASLSQKPMPPEGLSALLEKNYPRLARANRVSGSTVLIVRILPDGHADNMQVLGETADGPLPAADYGFGDACKSTLEQPLWRSAIDKSGRPVAIDIRYTCEFEVEASSTLRSR